MSQEINNSAAISLTYDEFKSQYLEYQSKLEKPAEDDKASLNKRDVLHDVYRVRSSIRSLEDMRNEKWKGGESTGQ